MKGHMLFEWDNLEQLESFTCLFGCNTCSLDNQTDVSNCTR